MYGSSSVENSELDTADLENAHSNQVNHEDHHDLENQGWLSRWLEKKFLIKERGSTVSKEFWAGTATFFTLSYIIVANASMVGSRKNGIPINDVMIGTALSSAVGSFVCGYFGNLPFALAPSLGLSAYVAVGLTPYVSSGIAENYLSSPQPEWKGVLAACAIAGAVQMATARRLSLYLLKGIPVSVQVGTVIGMGLLIAFVALQEIGVVERASYKSMTSSEIADTTQHRVNTPLVQLGRNAYSAETILGCFGLVVVTLLAQYDVSGGVLIAVGLNTLISILVLGTHPPRAVLALPFPESAFLAWDFLALSFRHIPAILAFIFVGGFDIAGGLVGLSTAIDLEKGSDGIPKGSSWAFFAAGLGTIVAAMFGSTPLIVHMESATGLTEGGRTGLTSCFVALWFIFCLFAAPLLDAVPPAATSPILFWVGSMMMVQTANVDWRDPSQAIPAYTAITLIPFTFSLPNGVFFGTFISTLFSISKKISNRLRSGRG